LHNHVAGSGYKNIASVICDSLKSKLSVEIFREKLLNKREEINLSLRRSIIHLLLKYCLQICSLCWRKKGKRQKKTLENRKDAERGRKDKGWGTAPQVERLHRQRLFILEEV